MEEQLINFETAKLAKEKGFNEVCNSHFEENGVPYDSYGEEFKPNDIQHYESLYARPTQSLLQKWLRDDHELHIEVKTPDDITEGYSFSVHKKYRYGAIGGNNEEYTSYEEALEKGLVTALNLIL